LGEAIKLDPLNPLSYDQLGWTYHTQGEYLRAVDALEQALTVDPTYTRAWGRLGTIYYLRQNYEQAIQLLPKAIELAQRDAYEQARAIEILLPVEGITGPETVTVLRGRFDPAPGEMLVANIEAVTYTAPDILQESVQSCGQFIDRSINSQMVRLSPTEDLSFSQAFSQTVGQAQIDLRAGELRIRLENLPPPTELPYQVGLTYRSNAEELLGYLQPDGQGVGEARFALESNARVPLEYYYQLGLSYAYLSPPQCNEAIPWLLAAVQVDPAYYNPAWSGLRICPSEDSPPTPLPTFTPTPEEPGG
jgi:tetratricopeptide (TPR) repeat protein